VGTGLLAGSPVDNDGPFFDMPVTACARFFSSSVCECLTFQVWILVGKKKRKSAVPLLGSHQKCWIWGRHAVMETLRAGQWRPWEVNADPDLLDEELLFELHSLAGQFQIPVAEITSSEIARLCGAREHQGLVAKMPPYPYAESAAVLRELHGQSAVLVLAGIQDPFNFGSILRSADLFGLDAVFVPSAGQATVSSHVARSSVGAVNYLDIVESDDLISLCGSLQQSGLQLIAATEKGDARPDQVDLSRGTALVIGNEATGIPPEILSLCCRQICIPISGHVNSLNAAVAAGILCYELRRQRSEQKSGDRQPNG